MCLYCFDRIFIKAVPNWKHHTLRYKLVAIKDVYYYHKLWLVITKPHIVRGSDLRKTSKLISNFINFVGKYILNRSFLVFHGGDQKYNA